MSAVRNFLLTLAFGGATLVPAQQMTLPIWPGGAPEPYTGGPERDATLPSDALVGGKRLQHLTDVSAPTLAIYQAAARPGADAKGGAAVLVFPGGGYRILAYDLEGTEVCTWLNSIGVTCIVVKYRVPFAARYPESTADLEDAQEAMRITRAHAAEWRLDPNRIGVLGFSAGGHLAAVLGNHADFVRGGAASRAGAARAASVSRAAGDTHAAGDTRAAGAARAAGDTHAAGARPDFVILIYPGYLAEGPALNVLPHGIDPSASTPPTFLLQAEDDPVHVENVLVYYAALKDLKVPAELHVFAKGGHGYGLRPTALPVTHWPALVTTWLHTIRVLDDTPPGGVQR